MVLLLFYLLIPVYSAVLVAGVQYSDSKKCIHYSVFIRISVLLIPFIYFTRPLSPTDLPTGDNQLALYR